MKKILYILMFLLIIDTIKSQITPLDVSLSIIGDACYNGVQDGGESGIDCGGPCPACVSCSDGIKNQGETGVDCGGPCSACKKSGGGGGGGGRAGGGPAYEAEKLPDNQKYFFFIKANQTVVFDVNRSDLAVYRIELSFKRNLNNVTLEINNADYSPPRIQNLSKCTYQYFKLSASNVKLGDVSSNIMWFKIPDSYVKQKNKTIEGFLMLNYKKEWELIDTKFITNDTFYRFKSTSDSLGFYSIICLEAEIPPAVINETENPFVKPPEEKPVEIPPVPKKGINLLYLFLIITLLLLLSASIAIYISMKNNRQFTEEDLLKDSREGVKIIKIEEKLKELDEHLEKLKKF